MPRDVWCPEVGDRINTAYRSGGHDGLLRGLRSLGFRVDHSVCIPRAATERFLGTVTVDVPIERPLRFWYPLSPQSRIEDGRREVDFDPPGEILSGERIHQWIGARTSRDAGERGSDLDRIQRQQVLVRALLRQGSELSAVVGGPELPSWSDEEASGATRPATRSLVVGDARCRPGPGPADRRPPGAGAPQSGADAAPMAAGPPPRGPTPPRSLTDGATGPVSSRAGW